MSAALSAVFGGTGFLGRAVVRELAAAGRPVRIAARHPVRPAWAQDGHAIELVAADIRDEAAIANALDGAANVVNAVSLYVESGADTFEAIHVEAATRLARLARTAGVARLVQLSGIGVDPSSPSRYVRARTHGEAVVREAFPGVLIVRPSVIFGPGDAFVAALAGVSRLPVIPLFGRGATRLQPVHVDDVARAIARLLAGAGGGRDTFELGGAEVLSYREILEAVLRCLGRRRLLLPVPFVLWRVMANVLQVLPRPPLTRDQVILMEQDNVVGEGVGTFADLGLSPAGFVGSLDALLERRPGGGPSWSGS
jgi:uncharacterized protein YbjT (DUF2867 family)